MTVVVVPDSDESDDRPGDTTATKTTTTIYSTDKTNKAPLEGSTTAILPTIDGGNSSLTVAIVLPIICTLIIAALITFYMWRRRRTASTAINTSVIKEPSAPEELPPERQPYFQDSCYAVIPMEREIQDDVMSDGYSAIDEIARDDETEVAVGYNHVLQTDIQFVNQGYSHVTGSNSDGRTINDEYAQVNKVLRTKEDDVEDSYNKLNMQQTDRTRDNITDSKDMYGESSGYNHCFAGKSSPKLEGDGYSHLHS
ncbi:uncharacterized protein LOC132753246 isoform X2 [Ruditapes philippinarum]|uniref:uncharacterized protein LOC132753246 isoform X2 n=1 Tax=Ruditapes philippinarum TaxID=129788 RepID=UPI00295ABC72|nr:uncharacterized protein LOC132753246 isoform X2 [Ruditapes philippinarum]